MTLKRLKCLFCALILALAMATGHAQILSALANGSNYQLVTNSGSTENVILQSTFQAISASGINGYIDQPSQLESAACYDPHQIKRFNKKAKKIIKSQKLKMVQSANLEGVKTEIHAGPGMIIMLNQISDDGDDISSIVVLTGTAPTE